MFCPKCGSQNEDGRPNCVQCGNPLVINPGIPNQFNNNQYPPAPNNYMTWSIVVTILCCLIGGIVAIINSSQVQPKYLTGDYAGAVRSADTAKKWIIGSAIVGFIGNIIYFAVMVAGGLNTPR